jgi:hypothetical protein
MADKPSPRSGPLDQQEILAALAASGYPLELRLLKLFEQHRMHPVIGFRVPQLTGPTREIDLLVLASQNVQVDGGPMISVNLRLLVEAKSLEPAASFVGFEVEQPQAPALRTLRARFGGAPSNRIVAALERDGGFVLGPGGLAEAFDPMNTAPVCVQWAVARRKGKGIEQHCYAGHDESFWDDIDGVVRSSHATMLDATMSMQRVLERSASAGVRQLHIMIDVPVLVLATPHLWLFDAANPADLRKSGSLLLLRQFEVGSGVEHRLVDVVTEAALPAFIASCRDTLDGLLQRAQSNANEILAVAERQTQRFKVWQLEQLP